MNMEARGRNINKITKHFCMPTFEELAGNLVHELCHETAVDVALQETSSLLSVVKALLMSQERIAADKKDDSKRINLLRDILELVMLQRDFQEKIFDKVNYDPGNSDYVHVRTQMAHVIDKCLEIAIRWNVVKLPAGAGRFSSWEG